MIVGMSREWLNANMARAYPFIDTVGGVPSTIPCTAFVDCFILTSGVLDPVVYIESIKNTGRSVLLSLNVNDTSFIDAITIQDVVDYASVEFYSESQGMTITGTITIGHADTVKALKSCTYTQEQTQLAPYIVRPVDALCLTGIRVGDSLLTGEVTIETGPGITLSVDEETNTVNISATNYELPDVNKLITSDIDILEEIIANYGPPVKTINGVGPDKNGDIRINDSEAIALSDDPDITAAAVNCDYVVAEPMSPNSSVLRLKLYRDPQIDLPAVETLANNVAELDKRSGHINTTINAIDNVTGSLATQLTRLD